MAIRPNRIDTMAKVLLINGSPKEHGCTYTALKEIAETLTKEGVESEIYHIKNDTAGCRDCGYCAKKGRCSIKDDVNVLAERLDEFDAIVLGSPVYYAGPSGQVCAFADRFFYSNAARMAGKLGASVVSCRRGGASAAFDRLNKYFTICNMPLVPSQYWNQVHGFTPEDVRRDEEGLQTMRTLAQNMAWLLKCINAGRMAGIEKPVYEPHLWTHFIMPPSERCGCALHPACHLNPISQHGYEGDGFGQDIGLRGSREGNADFTPTDEGAVTPPSSGKRLTRRRF